jgi:hypothetical protein
MELKQLIARAVAGAPSGAGLAAARARRNELAAEARAAEAAYAAALRAATDDGEEAAIAALIAGAAGPVAPNLPELRGRADLLARAVARQADIVMSLEAKVARQLCASLRSEHEAIGRAFLTAARAALAALDGEAELIAAVEAAGFGWRGGSISDRVTRECLEAAVASGVSHA